MELIQDDNLTGDELEEKKKDEMRRSARKLYEGLARQKGIQEGRQEVRMEGIKRALKKS